MTDKVQKILSEIATRKLCTMDEHMAFYNDKAKEDYRILSEIEELIKALQEEPVSEDLEEACDSYYDETWDEHGGRAMVIDGCHDIWFPSHATDDFFKAGAKWQKEQILKAMDLGEPPYLISVEQAYYNVKKMLEDKI